MTVDGVTVDGVTVDSRQGRRPQSTLNFELRTLALLFLFLCPSPTLALSEEAGGLGAILDGFETESPASDHQPPTASALATGRASATVAVWGSAANR